MTDASTIALLARSPSTSIEDATALIQTYANVEASRAVRDALDAAHERVMAILDTTSLIVPVRKGAIDA